MECTSDHHPERKCI